MECTLEQTTVTEVGNLAKGLDLMTANVLFNSNILEDSGFCSLHAPSQLSRTALLPVCPEMLPSHPQAGYPAGS